MKRHLYLAFLLVFIGSCSNSSNPSMPLSQVTVGSYQGTFTRSADGGTMSGTVILTLADSAYNYQGHILHSTGVLVNNDSTRGDAGWSFSKTASTLNMLDRAGMMGVMWMPSFYLNGSHHYTFDGTTLHIWQDTNGIAIDFQLTKQ